MHASDPRLNPRPGRGAEAARRVERRWTGGEDARATSDPRPDDAPAPGTDGSAVDDRSAEAGANPTRPETA